MLPNFHRHGVATLWWTCRLLRRLWLKMLLEWIPEIWLYWWKSKIFVNLLGNESRSAILMQIPSVSIGERYSHKISENSSYEMFEVEWTTTLRHAVSKEIEKLIQLNKSQKNHKNTNNAPGWEDKQSTKEIKAKWRVGSPKRWWPISRVTSLRSEWTLTLSEEFPYQRRPHPEL